MTIDTNLEDLESARQNLAQEGLAESVEALREEALSFIAKLKAKGKKFSFVFVDHCHEYDAVRDAALEMRNILCKGGFCLFHDFTDPLNSDPNEPDYGVYQGAVEGLATSEFEFFGIYGCSALYRFKGA